MSGKYARKRELFVAARMNLQNGSFLRRIVSVKPVNNVDMRMLLQAGKSGLVLLVKNDRRFVVFFYDFSDGVNCKLCFCCLLVAGSR